MSTIKPYNKLSKIEKIKRGFIFKDGEPDVHDYGQYSMGLTKDEIKNYLRARVGKYRIEAVYKKFCENAGCNTMTSYECPCCDYKTGLMYHHDVKRFADLTLNGTPTYFD